MNVDVLTQYCIYADYPIWRMNHQRNRDRFKKIILYPSDHYRELDLRNFAKEVLKETWCDPVTIDWNDPKTDWRQAETEPMLPYSDAKWIYFNEQDWFVRDYKKFYDAIEQAMKDADAIGWWNPTEYPYLHPACLFIKREILNKTQLDFRAHPEIPGCDHYAMITRDLQKMGAKIVTTEDLGFKYWDDCFHLGGLTSNIIDSVVNPNYEFHRPDIFAVYNYFSRKASVIQSPEFLALSEKVEKILKEKYSYKDWEFESSKWAEFFV